MTTSPSLLQVLKEEAKRLLPLQPATTISSPSHTPSRSPKAEAFDICNDHQQRLAVQINALYYAWFRRGIARGRKPREVVETINEYFPQSLMELVLAVDEAFLNYTMDKGFLEAGRIKIKQKILVKFLKDNGTLAAFEEIIQFVKEADDEDIQLKLLRLVRDYANTVEIQLDDQTVRLVRKLIDEPFRIFIPTTQNHSPLTLQVRAAYSGENGFLEGLKVIRTRIKSALTNRRLYTSILLSLWRETQIAGDPYLYSILLSEAPAKDKGVTLKNRLKQLESLRIVAKRLSQKLAMKHAEVRFLLGQARTHIELGDYLQYKAQSKYEKREKRHQYKKLLRSEVLYQYTRARAILEELQKEITKFYPHKPRQYDLDIVFNLAEVAIAETYVKQGQVLAWVGEYGEALQSYYKVRVDPGRLPWHMTTLFALGRIWALYCASEDKSQAVFDFYELISKSFPSLGKRIYELVKEGCLRAIPSENSITHDIAKEFLRILKGKSSIKRGYGFILIAMILMQLGDFCWSEGLLKRAEAMGPQSADRMEHQFFQYFLEKARGNLYYWRLELDEAKAHYRNAVDGLDSTSENDQYAKAVIGTNQAFIKVERARQKRIKIRGEKSIIGDLTKALKVFEDLELNTHTRQVLIVQAMIYTINDNHPLATKILDKASGFKWLDEYGMGLVLQAQGDILLKDKEYEKAIEKYREAEDLLHDYSVAEYIGVLERLCFTYQNWDNPPYNTSHYVTHYLKKIAQHTCMLNTPVWVSRCKQQEIVKYSTYTSDITGFRARISDYGLELFRTNLMYRYGSYDPKETPTPE